MIFCKSIHIEANCIIIYFQFFSFHSLLFLLFTCLFFFLFFNLPLFCLFSFFIYFLLGCRGQEAGYTWKCTVFSCMDSKNFNCFTFLCPISYIFLLLSNITQCLYHVLFIKLSAFKKLLFQVLWLWNVESRPGKRLRKAGLERTLSCNQVS